MENAHGKETTINTVLSDIKREHSKRQKHLNQFISMRHRVGG
jgi:hypothetical protein